MASSGPMTGLTFKQELDRLGLTQRLVADAWGYSEVHVSRWVNDKLPLPSWVPYALRGMWVTEEPTTVPPKPPHLPTTPKAEKAMREHPDSKVKFARSPDPMPIPAKPADDGRPFRYMGGRKVYLD